MRIRIAVWHQVVLTVEESTKQTHLIAQRFINFEEIWGVFYNAQSTIGCLTYEIQI